MKCLVLALLVLAVAAGCGSGTNLAGTRLTISALNPWVGKAVFRLDCAPAGGDVTDPATACAALQHDPKLVTSPKAFICIGGPTSSFDVSISGRLAGKPVHRKFSTCWTRQAATVGELGLSDSLARHILPRRRGVVAPGIRQAFTPDALRPGDLVTCTIRGHHLKLGIPDAVGSIGSTGFGGKDVVSVTLTGTRHRDGSVSASCHRGTS